MKVVGAKELVRNLEAIAVTVPINVQAETVHYGMMVQSIAKSRVPVVTGTLRDGIRIRIMRHEGGLGARVEIGSDVIYAGRIEFGYHGTDSSGRTFHNEAEPYLWPAMNEVEPKFIAALESVVDVLLR